MLLSCFLLKIQHFKTSYVIVYHKYHFLVYMHLLYFKTSYVIVYRNVGNWLGCAKKYFKTSYVIVYHVPSTLSSDCSLLIILSISPTRMLLRCFSSGMLPRLPYFPFPVLPFPYPEIFQCKCSGSKCCDSKCCI